MIRLLLKTINQDVVDSSSTDIGSAYENTGVVLKIIQFDFEWVLAEFRINTEILADFDFFVDEKEVTKFVASKDLEK